MQTFVRMTEKVPIVVILGATGAGKSKLALELAQHFGGEIISADAMQMYKGLNIVTNKVTAEEQGLVKHHMIDFLDPFANNNVVDFRNQALPIVEKLLLEGKIPFICGGTNYYIESLLWKILIDEDTPLLLNLEGVVKKRKSEQAGDELGHESHKKHFKDGGDLGEESHKKHFKAGGDLGEEQAGGDLGHESHKKHFKDDGDLGQEQAGGELGEESHKKHFKAGENGEEGSDIDWNKIDFSVEKETENISTQTLYKKLESVDPERAECLHPKERRKICRSLQIYQRYGVSHSKLLEDQKAQNGSALGGALRFPCERICIIEVWSEPEILNERCNKRVDKMIEMGMVKELEDFHEQYNKIRLKDFTATEDLERTYTAGIFQSIGFKEFHPYLILSEEERRSPEGEAMFNKGVQYLKIVTRQYAKRQKNWMNRRFLLDERNPPPVYRVDSSEPSAWKEVVYEPAKDIVNAFVEGRKPQATPLERKVVQGSSYEDLRKTFHCDVCKRDLKGQRQYREHLKGKSHNKLKRLKEKISVTKCTLVLEGFEEESKMEVVKELKELFEIGNAAILEAMNSLPCEIGTAMGERKAEKIVKKLKQLNVTVGLKKITEEVVLHK